MAEQLANRASTVLAANIDSAQTVLSVTGASGFPSGPDFRIKIENELMIVTSGGSGTTTWTVQRGIEGTTPADHTAGKKITQVLTAEGLLNFIAQTAGGSGDGGSGGGGTTTGHYSARPDPQTAGRLYMPDDTTQLYRDDGSAWTPFGPIFKQMEFTLPDDFHNVDAEAGQSSAYNNAYLYKFHGNSYFFWTGSQTGDHLRLRTQVATFPSSFPANDNLNVVLGCIPIFAPGSTNFQEMGVVIRESATGNMVTLGMRMDSANDKLYIVVDTWDSNTAKSATTPAYAELLPYRGGPIWLRLTTYWLDGKNYFAYSTDGVFWSMLKNTAISPGFTADQIGMYLNPKITSGFLPTAGMKVLSFGTTTDAFYELNYPGNEPSYQ